MTSPPPGQLMVVIDWRMQPHFPGMDAAVLPPAAPTACPAPPTGRYLDGPFACTDGAGNLGCRYSLPLSDPLDFGPTPCLTQCTPGAVASRRTPCGTPGTETCGASGQVVRDPVTQGSPRDGWRERNALLPGSEG